MYNFLIKPVLYCVLRITEGIITVVIFLLNHLLKKLTIMPTTKNNGKTNSGSSKNKTTTSSKKVMDQITGKLQVQLQPQYHPLQEKKRKIWIQIVAPMPRTTSFNCMKYP